MLRVITPTSDDPLIPLVELKAHLREDVDDPTNDADIAALAAVAIELIEADVQRVYARRTLEWVVPFWRPILRLPIANVIAVEAVTYTPARGAPVALDPAAYVVIHAGHTRALHPAWGTCWPVLGCNAVEPIVVRFTAGASLPRVVRHAAKLLVGHLYDNREAVVANATNMGELPMGVEALISAERWA